MTFNTKSIIFVDMASCCCVYECPPGDLDDLTEAMLPSGDKEAVERSLHVVLGVKDPGQEFTLFLEPRNGGKVTQRKCGGCGEAPWWGSRRSAAPLWQIQRIWSWQHACMLV